MLTISAQFGALTTSGGSEERTADVQVRVAAPGSITRTASTAARR